MSREGETPRPAETGASETDRLVGHHFPVESTVTQATDASPSTGACRRCGHEPTGDELAAARTALRAVKGSIIRRQAFVDAYCNRFLAAWGNAHLPPNWRNSLIGIQRGGLPRNVMVGCADTALSAYKVPTYRRFQYFAGTCWNRIRDMDEQAAQLMERAADQAYADALDRSD